jgi:predicted nucleic acid-binding protein
MLFSQENEYSVVLDACVLVPMALCDTLLRLAEEPALYRPFWSERILGEVAKALESQLRKSAQQMAWRLGQMQQSFPQAMVVVPTELLNAAGCIPDEDDKHVLAAAIMAHADAIVTQNTRHFPAGCLEKFGVLCQTPDEFLIHQYYLSPQLVLDKLDDQGAGISQDRRFVIKNLRACAPEFCELLEEGQRI